MSKKDEIKQTAEIVMAEKESQLTIYDEDSGDLYKFDSDYQRRAWDAYEVLGKIDIAHTVVMSEIKSQKYYLVYGFNSFEGFTKSRNISRTAAFHQVKVGELVARISDNGSENVHNVNISPGEDDEKNVHNVNISGEMQTRLNSLGLRRIFELRRLGIDEALSVLAGETLQINDEYLSIEEAEKLPISTLAKKITRMKADPKADSLSKLKAENAQLRAEKKVLMEREKEWEKKLVRAQQLEDRYGKVDATHQGKVRNLNMANQAFGDFRRCISKADVQAEDPAEIVDLLHTLVSTFMMWSEDNIDALKLVVYQALGEVNFDGDIEE